jgi:peptide-methionine (S)-S-oxide reductase
MKNIIAAFICVLALGSCADSQNSQINIPVGSTKPMPNEAVATFAEGCFWHSELVFQSLVGVRDAVSGYCGGNYANPDYEMVCTGKTGHAESVQVYYDTTKISYETLVKAFFASMDPTQVDGQGPDRGTQYRSIAFYRNEKERQIILAEIKRLTDAKKYSDKIVTQVVPFSKFYAAEAYHQEYIHNNPGNPYVQHVSIPDFLEFKSTFKEGKFKM